MTGAFNYQFRERIMTLLDFFIALAALAVKIRKKLKLFLNLMYYIWTLFDNLFVVFLFFRMKMRYCIRLSFRDKL